MLQVGAGHQTELEVAFELEDRVPVEGKLLQLRGVLQALNVLELLYPVV
jgi:hypothetical protein